MGHLPRRRRKEFLQRNRRTNVTAVVSSAIILFCLAFTFRSERSFVTSPGRSLAKKCRQNGQSLRSRPPMLLAAAGETASSASDDKSENPLGLWWNETVEFWDALEIFLPVEEDDCPEAIALRNQTEKIDKLAAELESQTFKKSYLKNKADETMGNEMNALVGLYFPYVSARISRIFSKEPVKKGLVNLFSYANLIFVIVILRTLVPRLLAAGTLEDVYGIANDAGIPSKQNLLDGIQYLQGFDFPVKVGFYTLAFILEKLTLVSEILPIQIGLKTIAPLIFGGLVPGALISATCETVGAAINFLIGRAAFTERVRSLDWFGGMPLGEQPWFGRLENSAEKDGFRITLLLRVAHILPLPFDSYWYILGALPIGLAEFVVAHWLGCLKTAFLDASLGELLLSSATLEGGAKQQLIAAETVGLTLFAVLVSTFATRIVKDVLGLDEDENKEGGEQGDSALKSQEQEIAPVTPVKADAKTEKLSETVEVVATQKSEKD
eukprot:TRINITY_DN32225_c0_g1_i1.p1 TRINITY_DN32225_c0_g1~~TRINITY_DN32225_c0_g1_i1.p1  ORF type:complete len:495 (+),score=105.22 TRINITY_DN32225_c0_g1_i1:62-1546(+)